MEALRQAHERLAKHFEAQRATSQGEVASIYFLDHGFATDECESLCGLVQEGLACKSLGSFDWSSAYLPLIVCAVEVGYGYEGNGTDFWPTMEKRLGHLFNIEDRICISNWFAMASAHYGGVTPGESDWEQAFCHIAWPITHAVASKDIRRPFADCLRRFDGSIHDDDITIATQLSGIPTQVGSRRFRTWLSRQSVVAGIVRDLIGGPRLDENGLFSEGFRSRLIEDLVREPEIVRAVRSVKTRQKAEAKKKAKKTETKGAESQEFCYGNFFLRQDDHGDLALFGELPEMPRTVQTSLRNVRRKWQPRPWGFAGAAALPSNALRAIRGTFSVTLANVARANRGHTFFVDFDGLSLDEESARWLRSVRFEAAEKLAFHPIKSLGDSTFAITSPTPQTGLVWVLTNPSADWPAIARLRVGETDGGELYLVDAAIPELREWLGWPAVSRAIDKAKSPVQWLIPASIPSRLDGRSVFTTDDEIGVSVLDGRIVDLELRQGPTVLDHQTICEVALVHPDSPGEYELLVQEKGKKIASFAFSIVDAKEDGFTEPDPEPPWRAVLSHIDSGETELTRSDFFNRRMVLDIEGDRSIENLTAVLSISPGNASARVFLPRIPARLSASHPVWSNLIDRLQPSVMNSPCDLSLLVEIDGVTKDEWRLEVELQNLWWDQPSNGVPVAMSDQGVFNTQHVCIVTGKRIDEPREGFPFVSVAYDADGSEFTFDACVSVVGYARLQQQLERSNRILRRLDDLGDNAGLRSISSRYLQLASASSSSLIAEVNRVGAEQTLREWILQSVCGPNWVLKQREGANVEKFNPVAVWWQIQNNHLDLIQPKLVEPRNIPQELPILLLAEFAELLPVAWWDGSVPDVLVDDAAALDVVFRHLLDGEDVYIDSEVLTTTLREANQMLCGGHLADLVIPLTGGDELLSWSVSGRSILTLVNDLFDWSKRFLGRGRGRQNWSVEELQDWLNLLLYPERLRKSSWQSILEKLLDDRPVARAGAFVAWRVEQNARLEFMQEAAVSAKPMGQARVPMTLEVSEKAVFDESIV